MHEDVKTTKKICLRKVDFCSKKYVQNEEFLIIFSVSPGAKAGSQF